MTRSPQHALSRALTLSVAVAALMAAAPASADVNIYSYREPGLIDPLLKAFTEKTGIKTNIVFAAAGLNERLAAEGANSPADLLLTTDAGRLSEAKAAGLTQPITSPTLTAAIPAAFRDAEGHWFGLTMRARVAFASKERVAQDAITYEELATPKWKGRVCTRSGQHVYNTSLLATMIATQGEAAAEAWARGLKANLAQKPTGGDREQVRDVFSGKCDVALGNTYYMALMMTNTKNPEQQAWAKSVKLLFPNAADRGSHINVSGVALTKTSPNRAEAVRLIEFLASADAQAIYANVNNEYPVSPGVPASAIVTGFGTLKPDAVPLDAIARFRGKASEIMDRVRFDEGPGT
jgi:iron(III) transport system substrate-binding protein